MRTMPLDSSNLDDFRNVRILLQFPIHLDKLFRPNVRTDERTNSITKFCDFVFFSVSFSDFGSPQTVTGMLDPKGSNIIL